MFLKKILEEQMAREAEDIPLSAEFSFESLELQETDNEMSLIKDISVLATLQDLQETMSGMRRSATAEMLVASLSSANEALATIGQEGVEMPSLESCEAMPEWMLAVSLEGIGDKIASLVAGIKNKLSGWVTNFKLFLHSFQTSAEKIEKRIDALASELEGRGEHKPSATQLPITSLRGLLLDNKLYKGDLSEYTKPVTEWIAFWNGFANKCLDMSSDDIKSWAGEVAKLKVSLPGNIEVVVDGLKQSPDISPIKMTVSELPAMNSDQATDVLGQAKNILGAAKKITTDSLETLQKDLNTFGNTFNQNVDKYGKSDPAVHVLLVYGSFYKAIETVAKSGLGCASALEGYATVSYKNLVKKD